MNKLTAKQILNETKPGRYGDGRGLWMQVSKWGTKAWLFRYSLGTRKISKGGKEYVQTREMGLGPVSLQKHDGGVTLAEAREKRDELHRLLRDGIDPIEHRLAEKDARRAEAAKRAPFKNAALEYISVHEPTWRNAKHRQQWRNTLSTYAYPKLGDRPISAIDEALINDTVAPIWSKKPETASRVKNRIKMVLKWVEDGKPLPKPGKAARTEHHPALAWQDIPAFMERLRANSSVSARALEFTCLCAARTGATIGAKWSEIDLEKRVWTVPARRVGAKTDKPRRVPLTDRAVEILIALPRERGNAHVFVGSIKGNGLSQQAMSELMKGMALPSTTPGRLAVPHGLRSTFKDWCRESTNYPREVSEAALWHAVANKTEAAYARGDVLEKRRRLMRDWAKFCARPAASGDVVAMQKSAA